MEQFITGDIWAEVNKQLPGRQKKTACISYVTSINLKLEKGDILICDASNYSIQFGTTSAKVLDTFFKSGVTIYSNTNLHSKLLLTETFLVIGSSNLSNNSASNLIESAVLTDSAVLRSQTLAFCHNLILESVLLSTEQISKLLEIEVIKRTSKPTSKSKTRELKFGDGRWFCPISDLSERKWNEIKERVEKTKLTIANKEGIEEENIEVLRCKGEDKFTKTVKNGDQVIFVWSNKNETQRIVYPVSSILLIEKKGNESLIYYNALNQEQKISWTKFKILINKLQVNINTDKPRKKQLSEDDLIQLKSLWK